MVTLYGQVYLAARVAGCKPVTRETPGVRVSLCPPKCGISSVGRAPSLQVGSQGSESLIPHQICLRSSYVWSERWSEKPEVCWFDSDRRHQHPRTSPAAKSSAVRGGGGPGETPICADSSTARMSGSNPEDMGSNPMRRAILTRILTPARPRYGTDNSDTKKWLVSYRARAGSAQTST